MKSKKTIFSKMTQLRSLLGVLPLFLLLLAGNAMAHSPIKYPLSITTGAFSSISGTGTLRVSGDDVSTNFPAILSPAFVVNGQSYSNVRITTNGWIILYNGGTAPNTTTYTALSTASGGTAGTTVAIAGLSTDLNLGSTYTQTIGNEHIFEWANYTRYNGGLGGDVINFQIRLNHVTGTVSIVYGTVTPGAGTATSQVGFKTNATTAANWATDINNLMIDVTGSNAGCNWSNAVTGNANTSSMYLSSANALVKPASGLTYTWVPQANPDPVRTFAAPSAITLNSATVGWTASAGAAQYLLEYRVVGACTWTSYPSNPVVGTSANITGLTGSTSYQIRVQAQTAGGAASSIWSHVPGTTAGAGVNGYTSTGTFTTLCPGISSFPWTEGFETVGIPAFPSCWSKQSGDWVTTNNANSGLDANARTGTNFLRETYSAVNEYMWSPGFNLTSGTSYDFSFYWAGDTYAGWQGDVYYNTNQTSVGATIMGASFVTSGTTTTFGYTKVTKTLVAPTTGTYYFAINVNASGVPWYLSFDDFNFDLTPLCSATPALAVTGYNSNSASFSWTAASPAPSSGYEWELRTSGAGGSGVVGLATSGSTGAGVTNASSGAVLAPSTTYSLYVRSNCGVGGFSTWTGPLNILTTCADINTYPYNMPFDGSAPCWQTGFGFAWTLIGNGANPTNTPFSGSGQAQFNSYSIASGGQGSLIAPPFNFPTDLYRVRFKMYRDDGYLGYTDKVEVYYNTSPLMAGATLLGTVNRAIDMAPVVAANGWYEYAFNMPGGSTGAGRFIILRATSNFGNNIFVDDFNVEQQPSCNNPTALSVTPTSFTSANLSWVAASPAPGLGYEWEVRTGGAAGSGPAGLAASGSTGAGVTTDVASGLTANTNYTLWVRSICGGINGNSIWVSTTFFSGYCNSNFTSVTYEYISNVTYAGINNTTAGTVGGPVNYTAQIGNVQIGVASNISVTILADFAEYVYAFVDWNQDLDFNDVGETYTIASNVGVNGPHILSITPPGGATIGNTRMRVMLDWNNGTPNPCSNATFGEAEDYTLTVLAAPTCFPPLSLNATPTSLVLADVSWALPASGTPVSYEYEVSTSATPPVSGTSTVGFSALGQTTVANTTNYLHVRSYCGGIDYSAWATYAFFSGYCQPTHTTNNTSYITNVTTSNGVSNINNNSTFTAGGYTDFSAITASQYAGQTLNLNLTFANPNCGVGVWIDWNNDLDFNDALEQVYVSGAYLGSPQSIPYTIPGGTPIGSYRVRVRIDWLTTSPTPCGNEPQGEAEDYTLNVIPLPGCGSVSFAGTYATSSDLALACTGQTVNFTQSPAAPVASGITYRLEHSTLIGGPYSTVAGPQAGSSFAYASPVDGYYRVVTLCTGSPVAATWTPKFITISDPILNSTTPGSNCGPGTVTLSAVQTPALASVVWYNSPVATVPEDIGNTFVTPSLAATTTYYASAMNVATGFANVGTGLATNNTSGITPYTSLWENDRTYYMIRKSELVASGMMPGDITSMAFDVTVPGGFLMSNLVVKIAGTSATDVTAGFATPVGAFTTVYTAATQPIPSVGLNTLTFATPFNWNGVDNIIIEMCHENDITGIPANWGTSSTVRHTATAYNSVYSIFQDDVAICGSTTGVFQVTSTLRPNIQLGGQIGGCASNRVPVVATINNVPSITGPANQTFAPTILSFNPLALTASSVTGGAVVTFTPAASIYVDAATSALYTAGTDVNGVTQYFAPLSTSTYSAVATLPNGCSASSPFTITVDASGIPNSACAAASATVYNTLTYITVNTLGAVPGIGFPCGGIANQVWFKAIVPASGEVHVVTKANGISLTDLTASNIAMYTSTNCSTILNTSCNYNGGPGDYSYAYTQATPGSTVYIRVSGLTASAVQNGKVKMAVTAGLVWNPTNGDNVALPENWQDGDATAITTPSATQSIIIPAGTTKPKLYANTSVRGTSIFAAAPYYVSTGIDLNGFTLSVKGNWTLGPVGAATTVLNCNGTVEFNGTTAQTVTAGKTTFGNLTLNNSLGLTLLNTTNVSCILKHTLGTLTTGGYLVLRSSAANNAALVDPAGTGSIAGNVSVERKIGPTSGYHYLSSAVSGAFTNNTVSGWRDDFTIIDVADFAFIPGGSYSTLPSVWEYREFDNANPSPDYGWWSATNTTDAITPLKGFACVVPANVTVDVAGPLNNAGIAPYSVTLTDNGLNLLGNPYASPISWNSFRATNVGALSTSGYKSFVTSGGYAGSYGTWDGSAGTMGVTDRIASSQSFMATATGNSTVTAANVNRMVTSADLTATFYGYNYVPDLLRMDITGNGFASQAAIYFDNARSDAYDNDANSLFSPNPGVPSIYTLAGNQALNINAMGKLDMDKVVPLGVKIQTAGAYNLVVADMSSFAPSVVAYLEDTQAGTMTNLRTNPSYSVNLPVGDINNRFFIHFHPAVELNAVNETCAGNDGKLVINYPTTNTVNVVIKDANGNVVSTQNNLSGLVTINNLVAGNYVAEMTFGIAPNTYTTSDYFTVAGGNAVYANLSASANTVDMSSNTTVNFTATAQGATSFNWNFGDGTVITNGAANMSHTFAQAGTYNVTFEASNGVCNTVATTTVEVTNATGLVAINNSNLQVVGAGSKVTVRFGNNLEGSGNIEVINMLGEVVAHLDNVSMKGTREIEMSSIAAGQYMVKITNKNKLFTEKVYLSRQ